jgi:hypothetical protein
VRTLVALGVTILIFMLFDSFGPLLYIKLTVPR